MSTFAIYKTTKFSLQTIGVLNKLIYWTIALILPLLGFSGVISFKFNLSNRVLILILVVWAILIGILLLLSRQIKKNLKQFGELKITTKGISKSISNFIEFFEFDSIKEIQVKIHTRKTFFPSNADGSTTYLMTIVNNDLNKEQFVVSSRSIDIPTVDLVKFLSNTLKFIESSLIIKRIRY